MNKKNIYLLILLSFIVIISCDNPEATTPKTCNNQCEEKGVFCSEDSNSAYNCVVDIDGCYVKSIIKTCGDDEVCNSGECVKGECEQECSAIGYFCEDGKRYECGYLDDDICYDKFEAFCNEDEHCETGNCVPNCEPTEEICDGVDNNCDGVIDEDFLDTDGDKKADCVDDDDDDDGVLDSEDCAPLDSSISPNAEELCDRIDNNCDTNVDEGYLNTDNDELADCVDDDDDNDGFLDIEDCKPLNSSIYPGAEELCDGVDNNCNSGIDEGFANTDGDELADCIDDDDDDDGVLDVDDCAPLDATINPNMEEICNGIDDNCSNIIDDVLVYPNADLQGGVCGEIKKVCDGVNSWVEPDYSALSGYEETESSCDGLDNDCDSRVDENPDDTDRNDTDGDGVVDCFDNCDYVANPAQLNSDSDKYGTLCDCYDNDVNIELEEVCDGVDNNCNGLVDEGSVCSSPTCSLETYNNHSYLFCSESRSWDSARRFCNSKNYNLVTIESDEENTWVISKIISKGFNRAWIGFNDRVNENSFVWESGISSTFNKWISPEPNNDNEEDCGEIYINGNDGNWNDNGCDAETYYVCERNTEALTTTLSSAKSCKEILENDNSSETGVYYVNIGTDDNVIPQVVFCDMETDGGGWTLVGSWYNDYNWTVGGYSSNSYFGSTALDSVSSNFGNLVINDFRVVAADTLLDIENGNVKADWYYHYNSFDNNNNATPTMWKEVWAPQAHNGDNTNNCDNGYISSGDKVRQSLKQFSYSYNIKYQYQNTSHKWNNLSDWGSGGTTNNCDNIARFWQALTGPGVHFGIYDYTTGHPSYDSKGDGTLGILVQGDTGAQTGQDVVANYNALVGRDDNNVHAIYGSSADNAVTQGNNEQNYSGSTKLWWWIR